MLVAMVNSFNKNTSSTSEIEPLENKCHKEQRENAFTVHQLSRLLFGQIIQTCL